MNPSAADPSQPLPRSVLLLDDDPFMLEMLTDMLGTLGPFLVFAESDARRALSTLQACAPDLLLCDLALPDMDGVEFLQAAARLRFAGEVVLLSGMDAGVRDAAAVLARALGLRVAGAFCKPLSIDQLRTIVPGSDFVQAAKHFSTK
jgi:CheY-like chemotaxis protein